MRGGIVDGSGAPRERASAPMLDAASKGDFIHRRSCRFTVKGRLARVCQQKLQKHLPRTPRGVPPGRTIFFAVNLLRTGTGTGTGTGGGSGPGCVRNNDDTHTVSVTVTTHKH